MIYFGAPDGFLLALDARTGKLRWETKVDNGQITAGGLLVADGKVISNRTCLQGKREFCFIAAHDAKTGKEAWRFYVTAAPGEPGGDTWGNMPVDQRAAGPWGLPGSYDPVRKVVYWGVANPNPYTRLKRHGRYDAVSPTSPTELYSNSTLALNVETGKLVWYFQELPGDDWDADHNQERVLVRTRVSPDPRFVKWINPAVKGGHGAGRRHHRRRRRWHVCDRAGHRQVPVGAAVPLRRSQRQHERRRRQDRPDGRQSRKAFQEGRRQHYRLLPQHAWPLADRLSPRQELALHSVPRPVPDHAGGPIPARPALAGASASCVLAPTRRRTWAWPRSTSRRARCA